MRKNKLKIGMIGYQFMGRTHSHAYRDIPFFFSNSVEPFLHTISGRNERKVEEAALRMGWKNTETDWRKLIKKDDIDVIDIVAPNNMHAEIAIAAAHYGKHIITEKPLALNLSEAKRMRQAVLENNVKNMVCYNYRFAPAVQYAKKLIDEGVIGQVYHIRSQYLQDFLIDPNIPISWRLKKEIAGSGALGDIGSHIIDLARFLVGEFKAVTGTTKNFIDERPIEKSNPKNLEKVSVDDASVFLAQFVNGALGVFEATRFANGNRNKNKFEINGEKGSIRWDLENMNNLEVYLSKDEQGQQGFRTINCTEKEHPYASVYWPPGHIIGYEHTFVNLIYEFIRGIANDASFHPNFEDGVKNQVILEAVEMSKRKGKWISIDNNNLNYL